MTNGNRLHRLAGHQGFVRQLAYSGMGTCGNGWYGWDDVHLAGRHHAMLEHRSITRAFQMSYSIPKDSTGGCLPKPVRIFSMTAFKEAHQAQPSVIDAASHLMTMETCSLVIKMNKKISLHSGQTRNRFGGIRGGARQMYGPRWTFTHLRSAINIRIWDTRDEEPLWKHDFAKIMRVYQSIKLAPLLSHLVTEALLWEMARGR